MNSKTAEIVNIFLEELNALLESKTVEEALYWLIAYLNNGLRILYEVISCFEDKS